MEFFIYKNKYYLWNTEFGKYRKVEETSGLFFLTSVISVEGVLTCAGGGGVGGQGAASFAVGAVLRAGS